MFRRRLALPVAAAVLASAVLLLALNPGALDAAGYSITEAILQGRAWVFAQPQTFTGGINIDSPGGAAGAIDLEEAAPGTNVGTFTVGDLTAARTYTGPDASGTFTLLEVAQTISGAKTWTAPQTALGVDLQSRFDYTMTTPTVAPTNAQNAVSGNCASSQTYRTYILWCNAGGCSSVSPVSADYVPPVNNQRITVTRSESLPANATHWIAAFRRSGDSFANLRGCVSSTSEWGPVTSASTTFDCACNPAAINLLSGANVGAVTQPRETVAISGTDIRAGQGNPINAQGFLVDDKNVLRLTGLAPLWSANSGASFAQALLLGNSQIVQVCKEGCNYSSISTALAAITDASATKRYVILLAPGTYDVTTNANAMKSYVWITGTGAPSTTVIRQTGSTTNTALLIPADVTEVGFSNLTVMGGYAIQTTIGVGYNINATVYLNNVICGSYDSAENSTDTLACIDEGGSPGGGHIFHVANTWMKSRVYGVIQSQDSDYYDHGGNLYDIDCTTQSGASPSAFAGIGGYATRIYGGIGSTIFIRDSGTVCGTITGLPFANGGAAAARDPYVYWSGHIEIQRTNASNGNAINGIGLGGVISAQKGWMNLSGVSVNITSAGGGTLTCLQVDNDSDLNDWSVDWLGGSCRTSGSGTKRDVNNDANVAGFQVRMDGVLHSGTYTGAGAAKVVPATTYLGSFTSRLDFPAGDLTAATCTPGEIKADTGGGNRELCWCYDNAGTPAWSCVTATTTTGPTN